MAIEFRKAGDASWVVPAGVTSIKVHAIGCGANGTLSTTNSANQRWGGGSGAYAVVNALSVTPGNTVFCSVAAANSGADTWLNKTSNAAPASTSDGVLADNGVQGINGTASSSTGGLTANCIGDASFAGAAGGRQSSTGTGAGGGAGAAGPDGIGRAGGNSTSSGNGSGGGCDGLSSTVGQTSGSTVGAAGGNGPLGTGGGASVATGVNGNPGTAGTGGGGGGGGSGAAVTGGSGAQYDAWTATAGTYSGQTAGPGGGGGGASAGLGSGGGFGAGGGAGRTVAGTGTPGIIVIEYTVVLPTAPPFRTNTLLPLLVR